MSAGSGTSSYISTARLEQTIEKAANGAVLSLDARRRALSYDQLQEIECQVQIPIFGTASSGAGYTTVGVPFDIEFVYAPDQRDSPFSIPHFTYGVVCQGHTPIGGTDDVNNPDHLVFTSVQVIDWSRDLGKDIINGAQVGIAVSAIGGGDIDFSGYVHLSFSGYGAPIEDVAALNVGQ